MLASGDRDLRDGRARDWTVWSDVEVNVSQRTYSRGVDRGRRAAAAAAARATSGPPMPDQLLDLIDGARPRRRRRHRPGHLRRRARSAHQGLRRERDRFELALARAALERDMPRARRSAAGCSSSTSPAAARSTSTSPTPSFTCTPRVGSPTTTCGSSPARWRREPRAPSGVSVRSHHHQGVDRLGDGLVATGWAEPGERDRGDRAAGPALGARDPLAHRGGAASPVARGADHGRSAHGGGRRDRGRRAGDRAGDGRGPARRASRRPTPRSRRRRRRSPPGARSRPPTARR